MELLINQVVVGLITGAVLVLLALGLNLIFGLMEIVNFSHGAFYMVGAYLGVYLFSVSGSFWWELLLVPLVMVVLGAAVERTFIRPLYGRNTIDPLLLTFGLTFIVVDLVQLIAGKTGKVVNTPPELRFLVPIGTIPYPAYLLFVVLVVAAVVLGLWAFLRLTSIGLIVRAGIRDNQMIQVLGVNFDRLRVLVFALGIGLAGLAGVLIAPIRGAQPEMGADILILAFVSVVVGGMGSFWGAVISGILIGELISITTLYASVYSMIIPFVLMIGVIAARPRGLLGTA